MENQTLGSKVKSHFRKYKNKYIVGSTCTIVGVGIGSYLGNKGIINLQLINTGKVEQVLNIDKSINILSRRGHAGNVVRCIETGETFASQNRAAEVYGINPGVLSSHLSGKMKDAKGYTFEKVGDFNSQE